MDPLDLSFFTRTNTDRTQPNWNDETTSRAGTLRRHPSPSTQIHADDLAINANTKLSLTTRRKPPRRLRTVGYPETLPTTSLHIPTDASPFLQAAMLHPCHLGRYHATIQDGEVGRPATSQLTSNDEHSQGKRPASTPMTGRETRGEKDDTTQHKRRRVDVSSEEGFDELRQPGKDPTNGGSEFCDSRSAFHTYKSSSTPSTITRVASEASNYSTNYLREALHFAEQICDVDSAKKLWRALDERARKEERREDNIREQMILVGESREKFVPSSSSASPAPPPVLFEKGRRLAPRRRCCCGGERRFRGPGPLTANEIPRPRAGAKKRPPSSLPADGRRRLSSASLVGPRPLCDLCRLASPGPTSSTNAGTSDSSTALARTEKRSPSSPLTRNVRRARRAERRPEAPRVRPPNGGAGPRVRNRRVSRRLYARRRAGKAPIDPLRSVFLRPLFSPAPRLPAHVVRGGRPSDSLRAVAAAGGGADAERDLEAHSPGG
ncbi:hypothetical protein THAOC_18029, partial [Thalassiosira oceanica]